MRTLTTPPDDVRARSVASDPKLSASEQEVCLVGAKDSDVVSVRTEIPTIIKWLQSIEPVSFDWVRLDAEGTLVGCQADVPKGIIKLQSTARKSNQHSQMVSYGDMRGDSA